MSKLIVLGSQARARALALKFGVSTDRFWSCSNIEQLKSTVQEGGEKRHAVTTFDTWNAFDHKQLVKEMCARNIVKIQTTEEIREFLEANDD